MMERGASFGWPGRARDSSNARRRSSKMSVLFGLRASQVTSCRLRRPGQQVARATQTLANRLDLCSQSRHDTAVAMTSNLLIFPPPLESYNDSGISDVWTVLSGRIHAEPFNLIATVIFLLAILHTFLAPKILHWSHRIQHAYEDELKEIHGPDLKEKLPHRLRQSTPAAILHFLGEVEAVFGIWVVPLAVALVIAKGPDMARSYLNTAHYTEPLFVVVIMAIAASRPIVQFAVRILGLVAGQSPARWWLAL